METREGRDLFSTCRGLVRGSSWDDYFFKQPTAEDRKRKAKSDAMIEKFYKTYIDVPWLQPLYEEIIEDIRSGKS